MTSLFESEKSKAMPKHRIAFDVHFMVKLRALWWRGTSANDETRFK